MPDLFGSSWSRTDLLRRVGRLEQVAGVRLVTLDDGIGRGVRVLEFRTGGGLSFDVIVDRSLDIGRCEVNGQALAWLSATGVVGPWFAEPMGLGWFRTWGGGMLATGGLDHALLGGIDDASQFHQPHVLPTQEYGLHGRIGIIPARLVGYGERWEGDSCVLWAEGIVRQAAVFSETLELRRVIEAPVGGNSIRVRDEVENVGFDRTTHMYLYHVNLGFPVVDEGSQILVPAAPGRPVDDYGAIDYRRLTEPTSGVVEQCWEHDMASEAEGTVPAAVVNAARGIGAYQVYRLDQFRFHTTWRMLGDGINAVALEPTTNRDAGRFDARARGELGWLEPGEVRRYEVELGALVGAGEIDAFRARVAAVAVPGGPDGQRA